jgi:hypothetical protein
MRSVGIPNLVTSISAPSLWLFVDHRRIYDGIENVLRFEPIVERTRALWRSTRRASVLSVPDCLGQRQRGSICLRAAPVSGLIDTAARATRAEPERNRLPSWAHSRQSCGMRPLLSHVMATGPNALKPATISSAGSIEWLGERVRTVVHVPAVVEDACEQAPRQLTGVVEQRECRGHKNQRKSRRDDETANDSNRHR